MRAPTMQRLFMSFPCHSGLEMKCVFIWKFYVYTVLLICDLFILRQSQ